MRNSWISLVGVQQEAHFKTSNLVVTMGFLLLRTFANNQKQIDLLTGYCSENGCGVDNTITTVEATEKG